LAENDTHDLITLAADIVAAHVSHNNVAVGDLPGLIQSVHSALVNVSAPKAIEEPAPEPAVSIRSSIKPDYLVCLEDGKKLKMLKRYLHTNYKMTPAEYRAKWGLPKDYPMVAPNYRKTRSSLALKIGLGKSRLASTSQGKLDVVDGSEEVGVTVKESPKRGRPAKAAVAPLKAVSAPTPAPRKKLKVATPN